MSLPGGPPAWWRVAASLTAAGWGANQFAPMLLAYAGSQGWSATLVTAIFAAYVAGLVPALLGAAWWSQHHGKRPMVRAASLLMLAGTALLLAGAEQPALLFAGRVVSGVGIGFAMAPGTAWITELSHAAPKGTGARRSTIALTAGFALGPLAAGACAQWLPWPLHLAYVVHLVVQAAASALVWRVAEADRGDHPTPSVGAVAAHLRGAWFVRQVLPSAPWVFGVATVAFAVVPSFTPGLPGVPRIAAAGLAAGLTLGTSVAVQPLVRRFSGPDPGRTPPLGMAVATLGMGLATASAVWPHPGWLVAVALVLGAAHGLLVVGCLTLAEHHTPARLLAPVTAVVYCLTYVGFTAPFVVSVLALVAPPTVVLGAGVAVAAVTAAWLAALRARPVTAAPGR